MQNTSKFFLKKTVAVTGANGYLASVIIPMLLGEGARVICVSRSPFATFDKVEYIVADIQSPKVWMKLVDQAEIIIHLGGNTSIYDAKKDPLSSLQSTVSPIIHLINSAKKLNKSPKIIYASTASIYGNSPTLPASESDAPDIITTYDLHKRVAEQHILLGSSQGIINGVSLRLANVYGPSTITTLSNDRGILNKVTRIALAGNPITVFGDGKYLRDYIYISDVASAFLEAARSNNISGKIFNIGSGHGKYIKDAFSCIKELAEQKINHKIPFHFEPWPDDADDIERRNFYADISSFQESTEWAPKVMFEDGAKKTVNYFFSENTL